MEELDLQTRHRASRGDRRAFKRLYDYYAPFIWKVVYQTVSGDETAAREIVQTTFIRVWKSLKQFKGEAAFSTWLYRIAWNAAASFHTSRNNHRNRTVEYYDERTETPATVPYEQREEVSNLRSALSPDDRFLLTAQVVSGFAFSELAEITDSTPGALRVRLHRIRSRLRKERDHAPV